MRTKAPAQLPIFRSDLQARLLAVLASAPADWLATRELAERTDASAAGLHRELARLYGAGILERERVGRALRYRLDSRSPLYEPLTELIRRTLGVEARLASLLGGVEGVQAAAIHGSWAAGDLRSDSDIDVLVIGTVALADLLAVVRPLEQTAGREIQVRRYTSDEFRQHRNQGNGFLATVLARPLIALVGDPGRWGIA